MNQMIVLYGNRDMENINVFSVICNTRTELMLSVKLIETVYKENLKNIETFYVDANDCLIKVKHIYCISKDNLVSCTEQLHNNKCLYKSINK